MRDELDPTKCVKLLWRNWHSTQCTNRRKFGDFCGVHSPEKKAERAKARGPTQYERDVARRKERRAQLDTLVSAAYGVLEHGQEGLLPLDTAETLAEALKPYPRPPTAGRDKEK